MDFLTTKEINCLENYQFLSPELSKNRLNRNKNEYLLCVRTIQNVKQIDKVRRADVTLWEIAKSCFGRGKLAGCDLHLNAIAEYLEQRNLSALTVESQAYRCIHGIASRMLIYRKTGSKIPALWEKLATRAQKFTIERVEQHYHDGVQSHYETKSSKERYLLLTPLTTVGHLLAQVKLLEKWSEKASDKIAAVKVGGIGTHYQHWYIPFSPSQATDESSIKGLLFRMVEKESHTFSMPPPPIIEPIDYTRYRW